MGTISSASAFFGLKATGTVTGTNATGISGSIGVNQSAQAFSDADICWSTKVTANSAQDKATATLSSGAWAQTTGTPTITDGDGNDFEGTALVTMVTLYAILIETTYTTDAIGIAASSTSLPDVTSVGGPGGCKLLQIFPSGLASPGTLAFEFGPSGTSGDNFTLTVLGKSS